jgi:hypothetical protein
MEGGEVSPYIFDASRRKPGEWPGRWGQTGQRFTWAFPDQSMQIEGNIQRPGRPAARLAGTEASPGGRSAVACTALPKLPKVGEGLVVPRDSRFLNLDGGEGTLKVPAGISLQEQGTR